MWPNHGRMSNFNRFDEQELGGLAVYKLVGDVKALNAIVLQFTFLYIQG